MKITTSLMTLIMLCLSVSTVSAHPANAVSPAYNQETETLTVDITHNTSTPDKHFIQKAEVFVNGKKVDEQTFSAQDTQNGLTYTTPLSNVLSGDIIEVSCTCNRGGTKSGSVTIP